MPNPFSIIELRRQSGARVRRARRWRLSLIIGIALFVFLVLAAVALIAPPFVKRQLERRLAAALHRKVTIRDVHLNPFVLSTTIDGIAINDPDGRLLFGCDELYIHFDAWSLFSSQWILKEISLTAPAARLEINKDGTLNIADLLAPSAKNSPAPEKSRPIRIRQLIVARAHFDFADHRYAQDFATELGPLDFSLKNFSTVPVAPGAPYEFIASTESGESLHWRGTLSANPLRSAGEFALGQIALKKYAPYYAGLVHGDILAGTLDAAGRYEIDLSAVPRVMKLVGGELHLHGLQLALPGTATPVLDLPAADLTGLDASLAPLKVSAAKLELAGGNLALQRAADGTLNLAKIFAVPAGSPSSSPPPSAAPDVALAALAVHGLALTFDDAATPRPAHNAITSVDFSAQGISLTPGAPPVPIELELRFSPQGVLALKGTVTLAPCRADLVGDLADFPLPGLSPYLEPQLNLHVTEGTVSAHGQLTVAAPANAPPQIVFHGNVGLGRCATVDGGSGEDLASFASLGFDQVDFASAPFALAIAQISFIEPSLHFKVYQDGSTNLGTVLRRTAPENSGGKVPQPVIAAAQPASGVSKITIGRIVLANASLTFTDRSINPATSLKVDQLAGVISGLSSDESARAAVDLHAQVDKSASITIAGEINPLSSDMFTDLTVSGDNIDLQPASPYLGKYAGYALGRGELSFATKVHLEQRHLDSQNVATLNQFTLGGKTNSPDATSLPVHLAVALLKDASGKIVVDLPVQGSLDDPDFRVGRVVLRVITNLLTKAAISPFSLLGSMLGGGEQPLDHIDFAPGSSTLAEAETKKLDVLVRALVARPGLNLEVAGAADSEADAPTLQTQKLKQFLRTRIWELRRATNPNQPPVEQLQITPDDLNRALVALYFRTFQPGPATKGAVAPAQEDAPVFPRNPNRFYGQTGSTPRTETNAPAAVSQAAAANSPPAAAPKISLREMVVRLSARMQIDDNDLRQLAADRAQHVKDYLLAQGVSDERVLSAKPVPDSVPRVTFRLK